MMNHSKSIPKSINNKYHTNILHFKSKEIIPCSARLLIAELPENAQYRRFNRFLRFSLASSRMNMNNVLDFDNYRKTRRKIWKLQEKIGSPAKTSDDDCV